MIKFESNMLVLNNAFSEEDVHQIDAYAEYVRSQERERIVGLLSGYANAECPEVCGPICECFAKHEAQMFISLIRGGALDSE
jgi:hypothetical protein